MKNSLPENSGASYARITRRRLYLLIVMFIALVLSVAIDILTGPSGLPLNTIIKGLFAPDSISQGEQVILWSIRLPYALMAIVVGASLGLAGAETQTALNNPLASPYTLGISWAATLGAVFAIIIGLDQFGISQNIAVPLTAFVFSFLAGLAIIMLAQIFGSRTETIILFGISLVFLCTAFIYLLQFIADADDVQQSVFWSMGSLARASWDKVGIVALVFILTAPFSFKSAWPMTLLRCGEQQASSSGLSVHRLRLICFFRACLLAATAVSFAGAIGFIGLVGPHISRLALGEDHRFYLPGAALIGALLLSLASICSKLIVPGVILPVGIVTALVGVPVFVALIVSSRKMQ